MIKYSSETYLKGVLEYNLNIFVDSDKPYYIVVKKIKKIDKPFILNEYGKDITILNKNYYILEYIPKDENYICRIFINDCKKLIERIFLFTGRNDVDNGIPTYDDLKLSHICIENKWKKYNLELFNKMYKKKEIDEGIYNLILNKIDDVKNINLPFDYKKYLN